MEKKYQILCFSLLLKRNYFILTQSGWRIKTKKVPARFSLWRNLEQLCVHFIKANELTSLISFSFSALPPLTLILQVITKEFLLIMQPFFLLENNLRVKKHLKGKMGKSLFEVGHFSQNSCWLMYFTLFL